MTLWIEWSVIDDDLIGFYIWNNLPDPTGTGKRYGFPNTTFLQYGGDGKFSLRGRLLQPGRRRAGVRASGCTAGGRRDTPQDRSLRGHRRLDTPAARRRVPARGGRGVSSRSTAEAAAARRRDRRLGPVGRPVHRRRPVPRAPLRLLQRAGRDPRVDQVGDAAVPDDGVPAVVLAHRRQPRQRPDPQHPSRRPTGDDGYYGFDVNTILHYAGNGKWSYEEDVYSPRRGAGHGQPVDRGRRRAPVELTTTGLVVVYAKCVRVDDEGTVGRVGGRRAPSRSCSSPDGAVGRAHASSSPHDREPGDAGHRLHPRDHPRAR